MASEPMVAIPKEGKERVFLDAPFGERELAAIGPATRSVRVWSFGQCRALNLLAKQLRHIPPVQLHLLLVGFSNTSIDFLRDFPPVRGIHLNMRGLESLEPLQHADVNLTQVSLSATRRKLDLSVLGRFRNLKRLSLERQQKGIECLREFRHLESVSLRSITLSDLSLLVGLPKLEWLWLGLGGTKSLRGIEECPALRYLEVWRVLGLTDLSPIADCLRLEELKLEQLRQVRAIPSFARLKKLTTIRLWGLPTLNDLHPVAAAPSLKYLSCSDRTRRPSDFACFNRKPRLEVLGTGLGKEKDRREAWRLAGVDGTKTMPEESLRSLHNSD